MRTRIAEILLYALVIGVAVTTARFFDAPAWLETGAIIGALFLAMAFAPRFLARR